MGIRSQQTSAEPESFANEKQVCGFSQTWVAASLVLPANGRRGADKQPTVVRLKRSGVTLWDTVTGCLVLHREKTMECLYACSMPSSGRSPLIALRLSRVH